MPVAVPAARLVGELGKVVETGGRPELARDVVADQLHLNAQVLVHGDVGPQGSEVLGAHPDEVTRAAVAGGCAEDLRRVLEDGQRPPGHGGEGGDAVVATHDAARLAAATGAHGVALEHDHVPHTELGQGARRAESRHAATDHHDVGRAGRSHGDEVGQPGIQLVPARGILAMAAASTVSAARSSGSRWCTEDLPQARVSAVTSMVRARR